MRGQSRHRGELRPRRTPRDPGSSARRALAALLAVAALATACSAADADPARPSPAGAVAPSVVSAGAPAGGATPAGPSIWTGPSPASAPAAVVLSRRRVTSWAYQLQDYAGDRLDALSRAPHGLVVVDLARDAHTDWFTSGELAALHARGKTALAYFEIGSIENFRPEYAALRRGGAPLILNQWGEWPEEYFVRYWDQRWWGEVIRPRIDHALRAGFDGVYIDTPLAYEQIDLRTVPGWNRDRLARAMVDLIARISRYAKARRPGFWIFPQNSPELRRHPGYTAAIDGIGMEELFFEATDRPCTQDYCAENLAETRALRAAGKAVLAVDYARSPQNVAAACAAYRREGFLGYVTTVDLDRIGPGCP